MKDKFVDGFINGYTTMELCNHYGLTGDDVCEYFKGLSEDDFVKHQEELYARIEKLFLEGYSPSSIAAKTYVARSIVSKVLSKIS